MGKTANSMKHTLIVVALFASGFASTVLAAETPEEAGARIAKFEKIAEHALEPPVLNTSPLPAYDYDKLDYGMTIGIERTPGGRLWACWVAGGDSPKAFFVLATSDDDGETWSQPRLVVDAHAKDLPRPRSILVGNLWTDPLGRLWLIFDQSMDMFDGRAGVWAAICENPDAAQPTWSEPRRIWHGVTLNKPTVLAGGEWMLPISLDQRGGFGPFQGCFAELDSMRGANVFVSTNQGQTWERRGMATFPQPDWHEHMIVQRKDRSLWMLARTKTGIMESTSTDGGRTWSAPVASAIKHPVARFHIRRLQSGRLLLVKHGDRIDAHNGRVQLSAWLSEDEGKTWQGGLVLDERKGISYPDGFQAPDGTIYISYDRNRATDGEILLARFTEDDILARQPVGPKSKLKMLISRPLAREVAGLPTFSGPTPDTPRQVTLPLVDISQQTVRHSIVARGTDTVYHGHCDTVLLPDGRTMFTAWTVGHAQTVGPLARSEDAGRTWSAPLDVPDNWHSTANTPTIHRLVDPAGKARLVIFADGLDWRRKGKPPYPMHQAVSEDEGKTWTPMQPNGVQGEVPPKTILSFDEGNRLVMWSDLPGYVVQSESHDGGLTWSRQRRILRIPSRWGQPAVIRSPDGKQLLMLLRENSRRYQSLYSVSRDDAKTWSEPRELPAALTGDRHVLKYAPDGRLIVAMRARAKTSSTYGHYVAWVGRFEDIVARRAGQYCIKLLHNAARTESDSPGKGNADCGYSDLEVLPDGTVIATTYIKYASGSEQNSVVNTRFRLKETDLLASVRDPDKEVWTPLFNGKDLNGWHRQKERGQHGSGGHWGVTADGVLFGEQDPPGSGNGGLLLTDETYSEFELELSLRPDWGPDSGVFVRTDERGGGWQIYVDHHNHGNVGHIRLETKPYSVPFRPWGFSRIDPTKPDLEMAVDARTKNWPAGVYEESCTQEQWLHVWKINDWNRLRVRCTGGDFPVIETWVNDLKVCRFNAATTKHPKFDRDRAMSVIKPTGSIGLQVHGGKTWQAGDRVFWKDIRVRKIAR